MIKNMIHITLAVISIDSILEPQKHGLDWITLTLGLIATTVFFLSYRKNHSRTLLSYVPNVWTSLGILGTFISIVYALGKIQWGNIGLNDIGTLVNRIVPAFETSIIGITGAIITSIIIKFVYAKEESDYERFNKEIIKNGLTPEQTLYQILNSVKTTNSTLNGITKKITEGVLEEVNQVLSEKLVQIADTHSAELTRIFNQEKDTLNSLSNEVITTIDNITKSSISALQNSQTEHAKKITEISDNLSSGMETLSMLITADITSIKESTQEDISSYKDQLNTAIQGLTNKFASSIDDIKNQTITAIGTSMDKQSTALVAKVTDTTDSLIEKINGMQAELVTASISTHKSILDGVAAQTKDAVDSFNEGIGEQTTALNNLTKDYIQKIAALAKEYGDNTKSTQSILNSLLNQMKINAGNDVTTISAAMSAVVQSSADTLKTGIESNLATLSNLTTDLSKTLTPLVGSIGTSYKDYAKTFKSAEAILKKLEDAETRLTAILGTFTKDSAEVRRIYDTLMSISEDNRTLNYRLNELRIAYETSGKPLPEKCPHCDAEVSDPAARFCGKCGHSLFEEKQA